MSILVIRIFSGRSKMHCNIINIKLHISSFQRLFSLFMILKCKICWIWVLLYTKIIIMFKSIFEINIFKVTLSWLILYSKFSKVAILLFKSTYLYILLVFKFVSLMIPHIMFHSFYVFIIPIILVLSKFLHYFSLLLFSWHIWLFI